jgi:hypothetical protein
MLVREDIVNVMILMKTVGSACNKTCNPTCKITVVADMKNGIDIKTGRVEGEEKWMKV